MWRRRLSKRRQVERSSGSDSVAAITTVSGLDEAGTFELFLDANQESSGEAKATPILTENPSFGSSSKAFQPKAEPVKKSRSQQSTESKQESVSLVFRDDGSLVRTPPEPLTRQDSLGNDSIVRARSVLADLEHQLKTAKKKGRSVDRKQLLVALLSFIDSIEERDVIENEIMGMHGRSATSKEDGKDDESSNGTFDFDDDSTAKSQGENTLLTEGGEASTRVTGDDESTRMSRSTDMHSMSRAGLESIQTGNSMVSGTTYDDDSMIDANRCNPCEAYFMHDTDMRDALHDLFFVADKPDTAAKLNDSSVGSSSEDSNSRTSSNEEKPQEERTTKQVEQVKPPVLKKTRSWWRRKLSIKNRKAEATDLPTDIVVHNKVKEKSPVEQESKAKSPPRKVKGEPSVQTTSGTPEDSDVRKAVDYFLFDKVGVDDTETPKEASRGGEEGERVRNTGEGVFSDSAPWDSDNVSRTDPMTDGRDMGDEDFGPPKEGFPFLGRRSRGRSRSFRRPRSLSRSRSRGASSKSGNANQDSSSPSESEETPAWNASFDNSFEGAPDSIRDSSPRRKRSLSIRRRRSRSRSLEDAEKSLARITVCDGSVTSWASFERSTKIEVSPNIRGKKKRSKSVGALFRKSLTRSPSSPRKAPSVASEKAEDSPGNDSITSSPSKEGKGYGLGRFRSRQKKEPVDDYDYGNYEPPRPAKVTVFNYMDGPDSGSLGSYPSEQMSLVL